MQEPIPVIPLSYADAGETPARRWRAVLRACHLLALGCCAAGVVAIGWLRAEVALFMGPVLGTLGVLMVVGGAIARSRAATWFGAAHVGIACCSSSSLT
jgi:hypothetical protein